MSKGGGRKTRSDSNVSTTEPEAEMYDADTILLKMTELLCDEKILKRMKTTLFPQVLSDKLDHLSAQVELLTKQLATKEHRISELETKVATLEAQTDAVEQYSRRANLRFQGIPDSGDGEDCDSMIINLINEHMKIEPHVQSTDIERSHRVGPKHDRHGQIRVRPIIVRFSKERTRDVVYRARFRLKDVNAKRPEKIFVNEDLTSTRASLATDARLLKKAGKISDTWTYNGNILIKNARGEITQVRAIADLATYK